MWFCFISDSPCPSCVIPSLWRSGQLWCRGLREAAARPGYRHMLPTTAARHRDQWLTCVFISCHTQVYFTSSSIQLTFSSIYWLVLWVLEDHMTCLLSGGGLKHCKPLHKTSVQQIHPARRHEDEFVYSYGKNLSL